MCKILQAERERVGRQIRKARIASKLSHDRMAEKAGTSRFHLIKLEKGKHMPSTEMLTKIAEATGHPLAFFEDGTDDEDDEESDLLSTLARLVEGIKAEVRRDLLAERAA